MHNWHMFSMRALTRIVAVIVIVGEDWVEAELVSVKVVVYAVPAKLPPLAAVSTNVPDP